MSRESSPLPSPTTSAASQHRNAADKAFSESHHRSITEPEQLVPVLKAPSRSRDVAAVQPPYDSPAAQEQLEEGAFHGKATAEAAPETVVVMSTAAPPMTPACLDVGASTNPSEPALQHQEQQQQRSVTSWGDLPLKQQSRRPKSPLGRPSSARAPPTFVAAHGDDLLQETRHGATGPAAELNSNDTFQFSSPPAPFGRSYITLHTSWGSCCCLPLI